jgi:hypothetical protein
VGGMLKAVIDTVIGNLQLSIANVHIRWAGQRALRLAALRAAAQLQPSPPVVAAPPVDAAPCMHPPPPPLGTGTRMR